MWANPQFSADFFIFIEEILNGKLHFLCSAKYGQLKNESNCQCFSATGGAQESANKTTLNTFEVHLMIQYMVHIEGV